jgi:hypothetical protein
LDFLNSQRSFKSGSYFILSKGTSVIPPLLALQKLAQVIASNTHHEPVKPASFVEAWLSFSYKKCHWDRMTHMVQFV